MTTVAPITELMHIKRLVSQLHIGGRWTTSSSGATFPVLDPATGKVIAQVADATPADGLHALDAAVAAQEAWANTSPRARSALLMEAFDLLHAHSEQLALLITLEMGKPLAESRAEVTYGAEFFRWFAEEAVRVAGATVRIRRAPAAES